MTAPKRIVLEDTGERRYPKDNEIYVIVGEKSNASHIGYAPGTPLADRISCADYFDDEWFGQPEDFAIYRIVENEPDDGQGFPIYHQATGDEAGMVCTGCDKPIAKGENVIESEDFSLCHVQCPEEK